MEELLLVLVLRLRLRLRLLLTFAWLWFGKAVGYSSPLSTAAHGSLVGKT